ncbi:hypothetical protein V8G45_27615 [Klebsiella pneumoniae]|uniref:hypothetical protein n=1 Tax=Pseudomonadota TaxID=1224 RepID=UPI001E802681|nr:hypothetical protein [Burkholderia contaminans]UEP18741.1 hypothetical protein vBSbQDWS_61 [Shewanella phage vB_Sb_QDWS]UUX38567.1 hypothetical protein NTJ56_07110 [Burkholderia contaminans]
MENIEYKPDALVVDTHSTEIPFRVISTATKEDVGYFYDEADAWLFAAADNLANALEIIAQDDDAARHNGKPLLTSSVRMALDAALIKAGRKEPPAPVRHVTIAGVDR